MSNQDSENVCGEQPTYKITKIQITNTFKKELKKYEHDKRVMQSYKNILSCYHKGQIPSARYNCHMLRGGSDKGLWDCHLKGTQVVMVYDIKDGDTIVLLRIGNHKELGIQ